MLRGVNIFYGCKTYIYIWGMVNVVQEHSVIKLSFNQQVLLIRYSAVETVEEVTI